MPPKAPRQGHRLPSQSTRVSEVLCLVKAKKVYFAQQKPLFLPTESITGGPTEVNQLHLLWGPLSFLRRSSRGLCTPPGC